MNLFLQDIYGAQKILADKRIPRSLIYSCKHFKREMVGLEVPRGIYAHICGIDLIRDSKTGEYLVLEDNVRTPSGVSLRAGKPADHDADAARGFPGLRGAAGEPLPDGALPDSAQPVATRRRLQREVVLLTPGIYNSAYFEHSFLAQQMGIELVEGRDLIVDDTVVYMKTIHGLRRVDVIYRRVDDDFLDALVFRSDSLMGVPGLMGAYRAGNVALANAVGNGVADDKAVYAYVPEFIRYYLGEEPILGSVETYLCSRPDDLAYVLEHLPELVVKAVGESGGYGMLIGPASDRATVEDFRREDQGRPEKLHCAAAGWAFAGSFLRRGQGSSWRPARGSASVLPV